MVKVLFVLRDPARGGKSVEEIYQGLFQDLKSSIDVDWYTYHDNLSIWENIRSIYRKSPDLVHITSDLYWLCLLLPGLKTVLTIHDIGRYLGLTGLRKCFYKQLYFYWPAIRASAIVTVSEFTKMELLKVINGKMIQKVVVIYNPVPYIFQHYPKCLPPGSNVILQIGTSEHKNLETVIKAISGLNFTLNIVGQLTYLQQKLLLKHSIHYNVFQNLSYKDVCKLYMESDVVTFISRYEGFGMPVIEAQACGRPIIISKHASLPEIAATGAVYVDQIYNSEEIRIAIQKVLKEEPYRKYLIKEGLANIERFSREKVLNAYLNLYASLK